MSRHTPDPWQVVSYGHKDIAYVNAGRVVVCRCDEGGLPDEPKLADPVTNARLIAAAPDLLAACKKVVEHFGDPAQGELFGLRAAIAKAEGQAQ